MPLTSGRSEEDITRPDSLSIQHLPANAPSLSLLDRKKNSELKKFLREVKKDRNEISDDEQRSEGSDDEEESEESEDETIIENIPVIREETAIEFLSRFGRNLVHFFVEDWFLSGLLGIVTAILSISTDVGIEYLLHLRRGFYERFDAVNQISGLIYWCGHLTLCVTFASVFCHFVGKHATGSGIPELKVIMSGFKLKHYLSFRTLIAKIVGMTFTLGGGLPVGNEGPFVHMGAIVASLLTKATSACRYNEFFSNEGRQMEMLSSGCAVGIACTFSAPAGGVLYGIESTSRYFAVKNYWKCFFATTCSALVFRFMMYAFVPPEIAGTIVAYYQTNFPNEVFVVEEVPFFALLGVLCGIVAALFIILHRYVTLFRSKSRIFKILFSKRPILFTALFSVLIGMVTYPLGLGQYFAKKLTYREALVGFISNCTTLAANGSAQACPEGMLNPWRTEDGNLNLLMSQSLYIIVYAVTLYVPSDIFIPSFVMGACGGRMLGEVVHMLFPDGVHGPDGPQIYPGLYAVVGAAAYTGAVTHSLSIAVIVWETTGQLCSLLPVLIALMIANAVSSFLQPSIYESIIMLKKLPYLTDLPPSRISVHIVKVDRVMVKDVVFISKETTHRELREILLATPKLRAYPFVTDNESMNLLGSESRKYLCYYLKQKVGADTSLYASSRRSSTPSEILFRKSSSSPAKPLMNRNLSGHTLLANSPLVEAFAQQNIFAPKLLRNLCSPKNIEQTMTARERLAALSSRIAVDYAAIDSAPFQLVKGTSLYKTHTLFSLLALSHAYVTDRGRLVGVVSLKELRNTFGQIYLKGALLPRRRARTHSRLAAAKKAAAAASALGDGDLLTADKTTDVDASREGVLCKHQ